MLLPILILARASRNKTCKCKEKEKKKRRKCKLNKKTLIHRVLTFNYEFQELMENVIRACEIDKLGLL